MEIGRKIVVDHWRPPVFEGAPAAVQVLIRRCCDRDAASRPAFDAILRHLEGETLDEVSRAGRAAEGG